MRLPRMTTRRWMIAVAVVGVAMGFVAMFERRAYYQGLSAACLERAIPAIDIIPSDTPSPSEQRVLDHYWGLYLKYEYAADHPWLPVAPDPPPP